MKERKKSLAVFFSFVLGCALLTALLVLIHTNHRLENVQWQMLYTASDCSVNDLHEKQVEQLISEFSLDWYALRQVEYSQYSRNAQTLFLERGDNSYMTLTSHLEKGRFPKAKNEVVAERWTLLNLGLEPECGQEFTIHNDMTNREETCKLVGILSDNAGNKKYGTKSLYAPIKKEGSIGEKPLKFSVFLRFSEERDYEKQADAICQSLGIQKKQIKQCPGREDLDELRKTDAWMISLLLLIGAIIFYGVYRIELLARTKEYGILRAVGMTQWQLRKMILSELCKTYLVSVPVGFAIGLAIALFVSWLSGDRQQEIYLNNAKVAFSTVIPLWQIALGMVLMAIFVSMVGLCAGHATAKKPIPMLLSGENGEQAAAGGFSLRETYGRDRTLFCLGSRYLFKDKKTSLFVVLTICVGAALFTALFYQAESAWLYREDTKEMYYLNGQYEMGILHLDTIRDGIPQKALADIEKTDGVSSVKTMAGLPIRVMDDKRIKRNAAYYAEMNQACLLYNDYTWAGNDGTCDVYHSILYGYNEKALQKLEPYVLEGAIPKGGLQENQVILSIPRMDDTKENELPGYYRDGTPLMDYHAGDTIQIKYRSDFDTSSLTYMQLKDRGAKYTGRTYQVAAIVYFPYMSDCNRTIYPLLITSQEHLKTIYPDYHIQRVYIDGDSSLTAAQQEGLERQLIRIGSQSPDISTRSMIADIQKNEMLFVRQMVYLLSIATAAFILVLINIENNLRYRMEVRTGEIRMYRCIGMSVNMIRKMMAWENSLLCCIGILCGYIAANPVLEHLYRQSDRKAFGHPYHFQYGGFCVIAALILLLCVLLSINLLSSWKTKRIGI